MIAGYGCYVEKERAQKYLDYFTDEELEKVHMDAHHFIHEYPHGYFIGYLIPDRMSSLWMQAFAEDINVRYYHDWEEYLSHEVGYPDVVAFRFIDE